MVIHFPPARLRHNSGRPTAITNVLVATSGSSHQTRDISLGTPTCSARSRRGRWALYQAASRSWSSGGGAMVGCRARLPVSGPAGR